ncbi:MAG: hypothetical protein ABIO70_01225, partial [Pseudomonadota bacterium]
MQVLRPPSLRTVSTGLGIVALLSLAIYALSSVRHTEGELERREAVRAVAATQQAMELWERQILDATGMWLASFEHASDLREDERGAREETPWIDAFYLWDPATGALLFPAPEPRAADLAGAPCLRD